jgi:hypothetical protein
MNRHKRNILLATLFSLLFHIGILYLINFFDWLIVSDKPANTVPEEITVIFPENKPEPAEKEKFIVRNQNENEQIPEDSNLLSDRNSKAKNPDRTELIKENTPASKGNTPFPELFQSSGQNQPVKPFNYKPFSSKALTGQQTLAENYASGQADPNQKQNENSQMQQAGLGASQLYEQQKFSVEEVGSMSLSTYAWEWAPYINNWKIKFNHVWTLAVPPAYLMGLISGSTDVIFEIDRSGNVIMVEAVNHTGHEELTEVSVRSIRASFPYKPLPDNFPDETLKIKAKLIYPDLRSRR